VRRSRLWSQLVPALVIVGALWVTVAFHEPQSGLDVRVARDGRPVPATVSVGLVGRREVLETARADADGRVRLNLRPGRYAVVARPRLVGRLLQVVTVRPRRYTEVGLRAPVYGRPRPVTRP
jgi:hypothetical protein